MRALNPYLNFNGTTEEAFNHYKSVFGGEFQMVMRYKDIPKGEVMDGCVDMQDQEIPKEEENYIMHISLMIGDSALMGCDVPSAMGKVNFGNSVSISFSAESREDADRVFAGLSEGGKIMMPMGDMFWGAYFGMATDKFGIDWMVSFDKNYQ
ncbi:VOC family protein [Flavobacterium subsaxonicum]|uniref:Glyoxalase n=1 Tax=Flavobacterium subsaxonicum WB 4.1-42 = DSM 21790 TaxID=1121898 RepID=A0A0A2MRZ8_9FLAO|nr:VOC family protein [Flavobacterium subsaxonicum]KGO94203.1 glyoxalase [Flavobacterium subsaxonicum WB 4.1-42 = DSM 21790]